MNEKNLIGRLSFVVNDGYYFQPEGTKQYIKVTLPDSTKPSDLPFDVLISVTILEDRILSWEE